jgi:hypothetical protein
MMKQFVDNEGIMSSADLGLGVAGKVTLSPTLPEVEYQATVLNGTGYKSTEANNAKDIGLRLSSDIYQNENVGTVVLGCYGNLKDSLDNTAASTQQVGYLLALKNETWGNLYLEGVYGKTVTKSSINGISIGGFLNLPKECLPLTLVTRFDNYDPDGNVANDLKSKTLWGVVYKYSEAVRIAYDVQTTQTGAGALSRTAYLHSMITF